MRTSPSTVQNGGTVVVLTALGVEYRAIRDLLEDLDERVDAHGTRFEVGRVKGTSRQVAVAEIGTGNKGAAATTERAIELFRPRTLLFVGVAGAVNPGIELGDVIVASHVYATRNGKEDGGAYQLCPKAWPASFKLEECAKSLHAKGTWAAFLPESRRGNPPAVHVKPVAAGDIGPNSVDSPLWKQLGEFYGDAAAIEMASAGVVQAVQSDEGLTALTVRAVSGMADGGKDESDGRGWQSTAADNAAAFAAALIAGTPVGRSWSRNPGGPRPRSKWRKWCKWPWAFALAAVLTVATLAGAMAWPHHSVPGSPKGAGILMNRAAGNGGCVMFDQDNARAVLGKCDTMRPEWSVNRSANGYKRFNAAVDQDRCLGSKGKEDQGAVGSWWCHDTQGAWRVRPTGDDGYFQLVNEFAATQNRRDRCLANQGRKLRLDRCEDDADHEWKYLRY